MMLTAPLGPLVRMHPFADDPLFVFLVFLSLQSSDDGRPEPAGAGPPADRPPGWPLAAAGCPGLPPIACCHARLVSTGTGALHWQVLPVLADPPDAGCWLPAAMVG